jgi:hypothetical protein
MEATHFIEVYKYPDGGIGYLLVNPIHLLENSIKASVTVGFETIAVWKIKAADTPIQDRLRQRGLLKGFYESKWQERIKFLQDGE